MQAPVARRSLHLQIPLTVPKGRPEDRNEDTWWWNYRRGLYALSDGASVSFDSASWSGILVKLFASDPSVTVEWAGRATSEFAKLYDRDSLPWMKQAAYDRGSFATLLGLMYDRVAGRARLFAVGDSLAVLCDGHAVVRSFPIKRADEFGNSPRLLSSHGPANSFLADPGVFPTLSETWDLFALADPSILCMTDALGHWLLSQLEAGDDAVAQLRRIRTQRQFSRFVGAERENGRMRRDDTTLLRLL